MHKYKYIIVILAIILILIWEVYIYSESQNENLYIRQIAHKVGNVEKMEGNISDKVEDGLDVVTNTSMQNLTQRIKNILIWTAPNHDPLDKLLDGQQAFINRKCNVTDCFIIRNRNHFKDIRDFDVILFNGPEFVTKRNPDLPKVRSPRQKYVYASIESSGYYPVCNKQLDGYFNLSWTYKLNSDISFRYIVVRDINGTVIGPRKDMHWMSVDDMKPINDTIKRKLGSKTKLAAWLVSNCNAPSWRNSFVNLIELELKRLRTNMRVDIVGACGIMECPRDKTPLCLKMFENEYYFYFSFENSFSEDYVTEKVLHGLQHYTVPVVYGVANYTRFMPDGIYLNANELGPIELAKRMIEIASDKEKYYTYFKWINHYSFHYMDEDPVTDFYCQFCAAMHNEKLMGETTIIEKFSTWWNPSIITWGVCHKNRYRRNLFRKYKNGSNLRIQSL